MERNYDREREQALRDEVDHQKEIMVKKIEEITRRGENLEDLSEISHLLHENADAFQKCATKLKWKLWWQNIGIWLCIVIVILVIVAIIAVIIALAVTGKFK